MISSADAQNNLCTLTHYVVPPAVEFNWSSASSISKSFAKSYFSSFDNAFVDRPRRAVGHVVSKIERDGETRWTSISVSSSSTIPNMLFYGVEGMFKPSPGAYIQKENEILRFLFNNQDEVLFLTTEVSGSNCNKVLALDELLKRKSESKSLKFGPSILNINEGGTGASYAAAMFEIAELEKELLNWRRKIHLTEPIEFYDADLIWKEIDSNKNLVELEENLMFKNLRFTVKGRSL